MGSVPLLELFRLQNPIEEDGAHDVASPYMRRDTAMRIGLAPSSNELIYVDKIPIYFAYLERSAKGLSQRIWSWHRLEIVTKIRQLSDRVVNAGNDIVMAVFPYYNCIVHHAKFKPPLKIKRDERPDFDSQRFKSLVDAMKYFDETLPYERWQQDKWLTAALSRPALPQSLDDIMRRSKFEPLAVFGICDNFNECYEYIRQSVEVNKLLIATKNNTIKFKSSKAPLKLEPRLSIDIIEERETLIRISIQQALAGPHKNYSQLIGQPVTTKVSKIYRGHLWRRWRVEDKRRQRERSEADPEEYARMQERKDVFDIK